MHTHIQKWGNSLALRIPKSVAAQSNVSEGSSVDISVRNGTVIVSPIAPKFDLRTLLKGVTKRNKHGEFRTGRSAGKEVW